MRGSLPRKTLIPARVMVLASGVAVVASLVAIVVATELVVALISSGVVVAEVATELGVACTSLGVISTIPVLGSRRSRGPGGLGPRGSGGVGIRGLRSPGGMSASGDLVSLVLMPPGILFAGVIWVIVDPLLPILAVPPLPGLSAGRRLSGRPVARDGLGQPRNTRD